LSGEWGAGELDGRIPVSTEGGDFCLSNDVEFFMRLSIYERDSLRQAIHRYLPDAKVLLYGSRADDTKRGGDIDLLILTDRDVDLRTKIKIEGLMFEKIGEQKIDLLIEKEGALSRFGRIIMPQAVPL
jgi:predicted nucleotidyltransferase